MRLARDADPRAQGGVETLRKDRIKAEITETRRMWRLRNVSVAAVSEMKPTRPADFLKFENFWQRKSCFATAQFACSNEQVSLTGQMYLPIAASFELNLAS
jgi:hypothetical protein